jgi:signal transduction histidine kinase
VTSAAHSAVQRIAEPAGLAFSVSSRGKEPAVLGETASVALRLVQEALNNVVRHAQASRIAVRLRFLDDARIGVLVVDDGVGFDKPALAGGRLHIRTRPGGGVAVRAVL